MEYLFAYFLDASVMLKLVKNEAGSDRMREICGRETWIRTTWICVAETYGVLKKKFKDPNEYLKRLHDFQDWLDRSIEIEKQVERRHVESFHEAESLMKRWRFDFSDAMQLVTLKEGIYAELNRSKSAPVLVTSDKKMINAAKDQGIKFWNPAKTDPPPKTKVGTLFTERRD